MYDFHQARKRSVQYFEVLVNMENKYLLLQKLHEINFLHSSGKTYYCFFIFIVCILLHEYN
jgi:hypothetical protein